VAFESRDLAALGDLLADDVLWGGAEETSQTCHSRSDVLNRLAQQAAHGMTANVVEAIGGAEAFLVKLNVRRHEGQAYERERSVYHVMTLRNGRISDIRGYPSRAEAATHAGLGAEPDMQAMQAHSVIPILNVSSLPQSFEWFQRLGWTRKWAWGERGDAPTFGAIESGGQAIFLCKNGQGQPGMWLSVWVDDVDTVHAACLRHRLEVIRPPQEEPWGVREMHVRHPDGHVLRVSQEMHAH
jgi:ketosteroid isomerase-like protein